MWGLGKLSNAVTAVGNKALTYAASTSLGKSQGVKPKLKEKIGLGRTAITDAQKELNKIKSIKKIPALSKALGDLAKQGNLLINDILADKNLDIIVDVIGNHINEYDSVQAFQDTVLEKPSMVEMKDFALSLIDVENYQKLATLMTSLQDFNTLASAEQIQLFASLQDGQLVKRITDENRSLDVNAVKIKTKAMCTELCNELSLTQQEGEKIMRIFDSLISKYLPEVNKIREISVSNFPKLMSAEKARISEAHPELMVEATAPKKPALTTQYTEVAKPKAAWKRKAKTEEAPVLEEEVVVKKEKDLDKKKAVSKTAKTKKTATPKAQPVIIILDDEEEVNVAEETTKSKTTKRKVSRR